MFESSVPRSCCQSTTEASKKQKESHDNQKTPRSFSVGDTVYVRDFSKLSVSWIPGKVVQVTGPLSYVVELLRGGTVRHYVNSIQHREPTAPVMVESDPESSLLGT